VEKGHAESSAIAPQSLCFAIAIFRVGQDILDLDGLALQQFRRSASTRDVQSRQPRSAPASLPTFAPDLGRIFFFFYNHKNFGPPRLFASSRSGPQQSSQAAP